MKKIVVLVLMFLAAACNELVDLGNAECKGNPASCAVPMCGGAAAPACPLGCKAQCYDPAPSMVVDGAMSVWVCDPVNPKLTGYGICVTDAGSSCVGNDGACGQDSDCCSSLCSDKNACESCRASGEGCTEAANSCCSGVCSLNACGG